LLQEEILNPLVASTAKVKMVFMASCETMNAWWDECACEFIRHRNSSKIKSGPSSVNQDDLHIPEGRVGRFIFLSRQS